jgi:hypothetical protein
MYLEHVNLTVSDLDDADRLGAHVDDLDEARRRLERLGASVHLEGSDEPGPTT